MKVRVGVTDNTNSTISYMFVTIFYHFSDNYVQCLNLRKSIQSV